jgi:hypothetical protein
MARQNLKMENKFSSFSQFCGLYLVSVENVGKEEEQLHSCQGFAKALAFAQGKWD